MRPSLLAQPVAAGAFTPTAGDAEPGRPALCAGIQESARVLPRGGHARRHRRTRTSRSKCGCRRPGWNGKFQAVGNGGWGGRSGIPAMREALRRGYATTGTDTGHVGGGASFALGHPEKLVDFAYRPQHEMTVKAKAIDRRLLRRSGRSSLVSGTAVRPAARHGFVAAQRMPGGFQRHHRWFSRDPTGPDERAQSLRVWKAVHKDEARRDSARRSTRGDPRRARSRRATRSTASRTASSKTPTQCKFDPKVLACSEASDGPTCLTAPQVESARRRSMPSATSRSSKRRSRGLYPGSEPGWSTAWEPGIRHSVDHFEVCGLQGSQLGLQGFDFEKDAARPTRWTTA